jgi:hypothetical protein
MDVSTRLEGIGAKLRRASEVLQSIREEEAQYIVPGEYGPRVGIERSIPERGGEGGIACRAFLEPGPPPRIGVLCGDVVHNLRSALDHLANALVVANGGAPKEGSGGTQFPIHVGGGVSVAHRPGPGASASAMWILEKVQPGDITDPLAVLNRLSNVDKHRTVNVLIVDFQDFEVTDVPEHLRERVQLEAPPFSHGQLMYSIVGSAEEIGQMWHGASYKPELAFDDLPGGRAPVVPTLERVFDFVRDEVVQRFAREEFGVELDLPTPIF